MSSIRVHLPKIVEKQYFLEGFWYRQYTLLSWECNCYLSLFERKEHIQVESMVKKNLRRLRESAEWSGQSKGFKTIVLL
jgi:hypothetical protein